MPADTPRGPSLPPAAAVPVSTAGTGSCSPRWAQQGSAMLALETLQRSPVKVWDGAGKSQLLENQAAGAWQAQGHGASVGAVPVAIPLSQSGSSSFPGCLPLSPLLPDTQHSSSSVSQELLAAWISGGGRAAPVGWLLFLHEIQRGWICPEGAA